MKRLITAAVATFALAGTALAAEQGASSGTPGHEMQDKGSVKGSPGASGYAPGHEKKSETTGSTSGSTGTQHSTSGGSSTNTRK